MTATPQTRARLLIFTLFGDYFYPRDGRAWAASILELLRLLGVSNDAARSALSRMSRQGWLAAKRQGRNSMYALTPKARRLLQEGTHRIFERRPTQWDGQWRVVVYSLPEKKRQLRESLRRRLTWLGFGALGPGTWVSPHDRDLELEVLLKDLDARPYVHCFEGRWLGKISNQQIIARCWNLDHLNRQYRKFLEKWQPLLTKAQHRRLSPSKQSPRDCFVRRFWIIHDYARFLSRDPNLPSELLPHGWMGDRAAEVFRRYRQILTVPTNTFIDAMLKQPMGLDSDSVK